MLKNKKFFFLCDVFALFKMTILNCYLKDKSNILKCKINMSHIMRRFRCSESSTDVDEC